MGALAKKKEEVPVETGRLAHEKLDQLLFMITSPVRLFKLLCFSIGFVVLVISFFIFVYITSFLNALPNLEKMKFADLQAVAKKRIDERLVDKKNIPTHWVGIHELSREYLYSIVVSEDSTFFEHNGFNFEMIANSVAENLKEKKPAFGASTISQQVAKNLFLDGEKTAARKIKEYFITRRLETSFSKNEILEIYLNLAEFGPDVVGVDTAARLYFHKKVEQINAAEGAFIALMLPSPRKNYYNIFKNRNVTRPKRRRIERVLRDMLYEEFITEPQYAHYVKYDYFPGAKLPSKGKAGE